MESPDRSTATGLQQRAAAGAWRPHRLQLSAGASAGPLDRAWPLLLAVCVSAASFVLAYAGFLLFEDRWPRGFLAIWERWDTVHYLHIAREGYGSDEAREKLIIWPPLYSWAIRAVAPAVGGHLRAGLLIAFACYAAATALLYRLVALDFPERVARRAILYFSIFPTAYFLHAAYTEAPFALMVIGAFYAARRGRWGLAGALGGLAALTRVTWVALLPALALEYLAQRDFRLGAIRADVLHLLWMPLGFAVFLGINHAVFGNPLEFLEMAQRINSKEFSAPWVGLERVCDLGRSSSPSRFLIIGVFEVAAGLGALYAALWSLVRLRASYAVYMVAAWIMLGCNSFWLSTARYLIPLFPGFVMLALWGERRAVHTLLWISFSMLYGMLMTLFVRGWWTY